MGQEGSSTVAVSADAQFGTAIVLRPLTNFESYTNGEPAVTTLAGNSRPIPFFDAQKTRDASYSGLDPQAGTNGIDPNLLDFLPCPMGSLMKIWVPFFTDPEDLAKTQAYRYMFEWRVSDINRYVRDLKGQYHLPTSSFGAEDTSGEDPEKRLITPSATRSIIVNTAETGAFAPQNNNLRREYIVVRGGEQPAQPLVRAASGGVVRNGVYQQGIIDPAFGAGFGLTPVFLEFELVTGGDRLLMTVDRFGVNGVAAGASNWDFSATGSDLGFSVIYGTGLTAGAPYLHTPFYNVGVYLFFGSAP